MYERMNAPGMGRKTWRQQSALWYRLRHVVAYWDLRVITPGDQMIVQHVLTRVHGLGCGFSDLMLRV